MIGHSECFVSAAAGFQRSEDSLPNCGDDLQNPADPRGTGSSLKTAHLFALNVA